MIDCKELMIHDYVSIRGNYPSPAKIIEILYEGEESSLYLDGDSGKARKEDLWPINLTKEFFINNGFRVLYNDEKFINLYNQEYSLRVNIINGNKFEVRPIGYMEYVHEFQHLLIMFKLYEYADNLKV